MENDPYALVAATLAAAILEKTKLPPEADVAREALRLYRSTLRKIKHVSQEEEKVAVVVPARPEQRA